jgi:UMF1 family MFS transporter
MYGRLANASSRWRGSFAAILLWTAVTFPLLGIYANLNGHVSVAFTFALIAADQAVGVLFAFLVGGRLLAGFVARLDTKRAVILGLLIYIIIPIWGFFLHTQAEFFLIGWMVGTVQGGTQALSRTIYASLTPRAKSGEFFGLYGLSEKFAGILGPLLYGLVGILTHNPRASILSIAFFFAAGIYLLGKVDEKTGAQIAAQEDAQFELAHAAD